MGTRKSLVDKWDGAEINIPKAELHFFIGDAIHPKLHQARYCMWKLYQSSYVDEITPPYAVPTLLVTADMQQLEVLIPEVLRKVDFLVETNQILLQDEGWVLAVSYVLAWFYHYQYNGPMPIYIPLIEKKRKAYQRMVSPYKPDWMCPACFKKWEPHPRYKKSGVIAKQFVTWLYRHMWEYHRFDEFQPEGDTRPTLSELATRFSGKRSKK